MDLLTAVKKRIADEQAQFCTTVIKALGMSPEVNEEGLIIMLLF